MKTIIFALVMSLMKCSESMQLPNCSGGSPASCTCGDGSELDLRMFPPCDISKVKLGLSIISSGPPKMTMPDSQRSH